MSHTPTTGAIVTCTEPQFMDEMQVEDPDKITLTIDVVFNGLAGRLGDRVTFGRAASQTTKQTAVRTRVNELLATYEPTVVLTNAAIQIVGLPV
jgi:hypothetical protein